MPCRTPTGRGAEPARALLAHLRARRHTVDGEVEQLLGPHGREEAVDVRGDVFVHFALGGRRGAVLGVRAGVDDPVHVDVQGVELVALFVVLRQGG